MGANNNDDVQVTMVDDRWDNSPRRIHKCMDQVVNNNMSELYNSQYLRVRRDRVCTQALRRLDRVV